jgi:hypothetical protein
MEEQSIDVFQGIHFIRKVRELKRGEVEGVQLHMK